LSYQDWSGLRTSPTLLARFVVAVEVAAVGIWNESGTTTNHANRIAWAQRCLFQSDKVQSYANLMQRMAATTDATMQAAGEGITDAQIQTLVNDYADALASAGY
jgi:hypothetical protein